MSLHPTDDGALDQAARAAHRRSLESLSPRLQAQLAQRRRSALSGGTRSRSRTLLPWAATASAGLALVLVLQLRPPGGASVAKGDASPIGRVSDESAPHLAVLEAEAPIAALAEDPDFYLWLGDSPAATE